MRDVDFRKGERVLVPCVVAPADVKFLELQNVCCCIRQGVVAKVHERTLGLCRLYGESQ